MIIKGYTEPSIIRTQQDDKGFLLQEVYSKNITDRGNLLGYYVNPLSQSYGRKIKRIKHV